MTSSEKKTGKERKGKARLGKYLRRRAQKRTNCSFKDKMQEEMPLKGGLSKRIMTDVTEKTERLSEQE